MSPPHVRTVLGDIAPEALGRTDYHEHLLQASPLLPGDDLDDVDLSRREAELLRDSGFDALVDLTPVGLGRDPAALVAISRATGMQVVGATGVHRRQHYLPDHPVRGWTADDLLACFVAEVQDGLLPDPFAPGDRLDARAGVIKVGTGYWDISAFEERVLEAAAEAHRVTGVPVVCHTEHGTATWEVAAQACTRDWRKVTVDVRGRTVDKLVHTRDVLWYGVCPKQPVRLTIVRDPCGAEPDDFFVTTDLTATGTQTASRYAGRWSIEVCFRDVKQDLGGENPQSWKRQGPERAAALSLWLHAMTWCWYLAQHPAGNTWIPRPWYHQKTTPSFLDALASLRRVLWSQRITAMSAASTPGQDKTRITDALLDTLAYAA